MAACEPLPPWARDREYARSILQQERDARQASDAQRAANGASQTKAVEASELPAVRAEIALLRGENQALRRRVKALEGLVAFKPGADKQGELWEAITGAFGEYSKSVNENLKRIDERIDAVRDEMLKFGDVFVAGRSYPPNSFVVNRGSLWISLAATVSPPGSCGDWQLVCKQGSFDPRPKP